MKNKFVYFLAGGLLIGLVLLFFQMTQASPAIPNPGHGTSQIEGDANLNMNSNKIINLTDPTIEQDAATKAYVDNQSPTIMCESISTCGESGNARYAICSAGFKVVGGGCEWGNAPVPNGYLYDKPYALLDRWMCYNQYGFVRCAHAICCNVEF